MKPHLTSKQIVAFRDGESTDPDVAQHLETCELCRQEMESARVLANLLTSVREPVRRAMFSLRADLSVASFADEIAADMSAVVMSSPGLPLELIHRSRSIGLVRIRQDGNNTNFEYSPLEIDHSFLENPAQTFSALAGLDLEGTLFGRKARPVQVCPFTFNAGEFRFTVAAEDESGSDIRIHISSGSDFPASPRAGLEVTLIDSENAPRIYTLDQQGSFQVELRSIRSILLLHAESSGHLGIELSK